MSLIKPNYARMIEIASKEIEEKMISRMITHQPRQVSKFDDKPTQIRTLAFTSYLIRVPYKVMSEVMKSYRANRSQFQEILYRYVPHLSSYTMKQKDKIMQSF